MGVKSVLLAVCWQMSCYIFLTGYTPLFSQKPWGECCIFEFPKYTHSVCWCRLSISAGGGGALTCMSVSVYPPKTDER